MTPPDARVLYGSALEALRLGKLEAARDSLSKSLELDGGAWETHNALGNCLRRLGESGAAEASYRAAIALDPARPDPWFGLAYLRAANGRTSDAAEALLELPRRFPRDIDIRHQAGGLLADFGCYAEAADVYTAIAADEPQARNFQRLGQYLQKLGRFEPAAAAFRKAIELDPAQGTAYLLLANTRHMQESDRELQALAEAGLKHPGMADEARASIHFALGKLHDDWREYDAAFRHYGEANRLRRRSQGFDPKGWQDFVTEVVGVFGRLQDRLPAKRPAAPSPLFIVGMLRSGTTLVDRLLANHVDVESQGETERVDGFTGRLAEIKRSPYPACLMQASSEDLAQMGHDLRRAYLAGNPGARYVIDKNPLNFLHVGLLALLLPEAPIVHCRRDPLDTCLSIYFQNFAHARIGFAYDLEDIAAFYAGYERLMAFWSSLLPGRMVEVEYEALVADPAAVMGRLYAELGLEWDAKATQPQANPATIVTASIWQARQPVYGHAAGRWRNYEKHLQPLEHALARWRSA